MVAADKKQKKKSTSKYTETPRYTAMELPDYDRERHIPLQEAFGLIKEQKDRKLSLDTLCAAIKDKQIQVYHFKDGAYLDRLDIGRLYHNHISKNGLHVDRYFTYKRVDPIEEYEKTLEKRDLELKDEDGEVIFSMKDALFPADWNERDATIVAQKYFYQPNKSEWKEKLKKKLGRDHEFSPAQLVKRITNFIVYEGDKLGYFRTEADREAFRDELAWLQLHRRFAFNSPVKFNAGLYQEYGVEGSPSVNYWRNPKTGEVTRIKKGSNIKPQCHACFITGPRDNLESLMQHAEDECNIFSAGSGVGQDMSSIRGEGEPLSCGGVSSGFMSFLKIYDDEAGTIKSGGKSRRAARMTSCRGGKKEAHQDIMKFIDAKVNEDAKALVLMKNGYEPGMDGEAYETVTFQNTNFSVRLDKEFFDEIERDGEIELRRVTDGKVTEKIKARDMLKRIAFGTWRVGDPGIQYESPIQKWHTCKNSGRINASNPCSEFMNLDNTSCNLGSHNLLAYTDKKGNFDVESFRKACRVTSVALDIINDAASYPVAEIAVISPEFRSIGLGYANLGATLMRRGLAYDSDPGRAFAAAVTSLMTATAWETSAEMGGNLGTFVQYEFNKKPMQEVIDQHIGALEGIVWEHIPKELKEANQEAWKHARFLGRRNGFRNSQVSLLAPTGTIHHHMGCQTTGVEPSIALAIPKQLAGGGQIMMINEELENALKNLGYTEEQVKEIKEYSLERNTVVGAPHINTKHHNIFETSFGGESGIGSIPFEGHVKMLGTLQPFLSGAISKTINFPHAASVKEIYNGYILGHKLGVKALAAFRDDSKPISPYGLGGKDYKELKRGEKEDLPTIRDAKEFELDFTTEHGPVPMHIVVSEYEDGRPGQIAFLAYKSGSTLGAFLTAQGVAASKALKRGMHLDDVIEPWLDQHFDPQGFAEGHPDFASFQSALDAAAKIILLEYRGRTELAKNPEKVDITKLRGFQNGAFETYREMERNDWNYDQVIKDPELGGFVKGSSPLIRKKRELTNKAGVPCQRCGGIMRQTKPNCFVCEKCSNQIGGCMI